MRHNGGTRQVTVRKPCTEGEVSRLSIGCQVERKVKARKYSLGKEMVTGNI